MASASISFFWFSKAVWFHILSIMTAFGIGDAHEVGYSTGTALTCTPENLLKISELCVNYQARDGVECFNPNVSTQFTMFVAVWCILNAIVGMCGNLLTLLAIPWAVHHKK